MVALVGYEIVAMAAPGYGGPSPCSVRCGVRRSNGNCPAKCCVDAETVLCLRRMPVMHRHQLALFEGTTRLAHIADTYPLPVVEEILVSVSVWHAHNVTNPS